MKLHEIADRLASTEKTAQLTIRISVRALEVLRDVADLRGVSVNALCAAALEDAVAETLADGDKVATADEIARQIAAPLIVPGEFGAPAVESPTKPASRVSGGAFTTQIAKRVGEAGSAGVGIVDIVSDLMIAFGGGPELYYATAEAVLSDLVAAGRVRRTDRRDGCALWSLS